MNFSTPTRSLLLLLAGLPGMAYATDWQSLLGNSPFGQVAAAPAENVATGDFEFRGVVQEGGVYLVNLYNPTTKTSQWLEVSGKAPGVEVQAYDAVAEKVQINQAGRTLTLPLKQARVALVAAPPPPADNPAPNNAEGQEGAGGDRRAQIRELIRNRVEGGAGGSAQPMRNLPPEAQAMIEEFRRRRAERAANQPGGPAPVDRTRREQP